jgi:histidinol dehydrogenase
MEAGVNTRIVKWSPRDEPEAVRLFLERPAFDPEAEQVAREVLEDIRQNGIRAVLQCAKRFDDVSLTAATLRVSAAELAEARDTADQAFRVAAREVVKRITAFARAGMRNDWAVSSPRGGEMGEQFTPLDRVGVYVPGGAAPLVSTALMTATLAKVAGVAEIVACTPCDRKRQVNPCLLAALELAGATEIYKVGGIQAIGLMAFGAAGVRKVQKIVGPGGAHVTAAKRQVYGAVALDLVAGPSEIAVLADDTARASYVAADLLSQAEHGTGQEKAMLVTPSAILAGEVQKELARQAEALERKERVLEVMQRGMLLVVVNTLDDGMELCNRFAPEHLEVIVREPRTWLKKVRRAGAVFIGAWSPEAAGDYVAGPSHVLPTGGTAAMFSGLTADDFRRRSSFIAFTRADLNDALPLIEAFGRAEGMEAHARSARIRFEQA